VRAPLIWLGEPDPIASVDDAQAEDTGLADIRELFEWCVSEFVPDKIYTSAGLIEAACVPPAGFNPNPIKELLLRIAGDKDGNISPKRLGEWMHRNRGVLCVSLMVAGFGWSGSRMPFLVEPDIA